MRSHPGNEEMGCPLMLILNRPRIRTGGRTIRKVTSVMLAFVIVTSASAVVGGMSRGAPEADGGRDRLGTLAPSA